MKRASSSELEKRTNKFLTDLLLDVPILRAQGTPEEYLAALERAILFHPVFLNWPTPMNGWLAEAEQLCRNLNRLDTLATVLLRRAVVHMRRLEFDAALAELDRVRNSVPQLSPGHLTWHKVTSARILTRKQQFEKAREILDEIAAPPQEGWIAPLAIVGRGELHLEANEIELAEKTLQQALVALPFELVEERIQVSQSLGFVFITKANAPKALQYLDEARRMLRGAGAWSEVIQMNLAVGSFHVAAGNQPAAQALFAEGSDLCKRYPQAQLETLLRIALARSKASEGRTDDAVDAVLKAATLFARQHNLVGYVSMIVLMANMYIAAKKHADAYRILATGVAIARQQRWQSVENVLRIHINRLRDETMGPSRFDSMVHEMIKILRGE